MPAGRRRSTPQASAARPPGWTARSRRPTCKGSSGIVMRFHGVCGRLVAHPLHENRLPDDTLFENLHRPSKAVGLETPERIDTIAEVSAAGAGQSLEIDREIVFTKADGGPHGFDASGRDAVEAGFSNLTRTSGFPRV